MTERKAFEAWWATMDEAPYYEGVQKAVAWNAWNRRAQPAQAVPLLSDSEITELMPPPDIDGSKARSPNAVRLAMRAVEQAVRAKMGVAVPMVETAWQNPLHPDQLSNNPVPNWVPLYRLMGKISDPNNAQHFSAEAACKAFGIVGKEGAPMPGMTSLPEKKT